MDKYKLYEYYSSVQPHKVEWLWYPYIPYGKLTILQGDPGDGKSTFILNVAALLTNGKDMPDGSATEAPQTVIYQCSEDNLSDTIRPRLEAAGADCNRIAYIVDETNELTLDDKRIEQAIVETGARLFILDPIQAYIPQDGDMQSAGRMRTVMKKIAAMAAKYNCAVVLVGHMNKSSGTKNLYRGLGSIDIAAVARSVLMIKRDKNDANIRYMFPVKSSLAPEGVPIGFSLDKEYGFQWIGQCEVDLCDEDDTANEQGKKEQAEDLLSDMLETNDLPSAEIFYKLSQAGISRRTVQSAKKTLGISSYRKENAWFWHLDWTNKGESNE